jgi:hypothetical protein
MREQNKLETLPITWRELLEIEPQMVQFIQWAAQRFGGLPEGKIKRLDYEKYLAAYEEEAK